MAIRAASSYPGSRIHPFIQLIKARAYVDAHQFREMQGYGCRYTIPSFNGCDPTQEIICRRRCTRNLLETTWIATSRHPSRRCMTRGGWYTFLSKHCLPNLPCLRASTTLGNFTGIAVWDPEVQQRLASNNSPTNGLASW